MEVFFGDVETEYEFFKSSEDVPVDAPNVITANILAVVGKFEGRAVPKGTTKSTGGSGKAPARCEAEAIKSPHKVCVEKAHKIKVGGGRELSCCGSVDWSIHRPFVEPGSGPGGPEDRSISSMEFRSRGAFA